MAIKVCVIGAGPLGLLAIKNMKEEGFEVTAFERRSYVGGIWQPSQDGLISVNPNTVFNGSRYRSAFTDFPFGDEVDDYPTRQQMFKYLQSYADHFDLRPHIQFNTSVSSMRMVDGKWELVLQKSDSKQTSTQHFDKIIVATGSFNTPKYPQVEGIDKFAGDVRHAVNYSPSKEYQDQNVLVVGFHASSVDVTSSLAEYASKVYLSRRNGVILIRKFDEAGKPFDVAQNMLFCRLTIFLERYAPWLFFWIMNSVMTGMSRKAYPDLEKFGFLPAPSLKTTTPVAADQIVPHLRSGFVQPVLGVKRVTGPRSVELTDGQVLDDIDKIIYCTGYHFDLPCVPEEYNPTPVQGVPPRLYRNIFSLHPDPAVRDSLVFMGQGAAPFSGFAMFEMVALAAAQIWNGKSKLPPYEEMKAWYQQVLNHYNDTRSKMTTNATYYPVIMSLESFLPFLDDIAGAGVFDHFSWFSWKSWSFWWNDRELYNTISNKLFSPAIFRLFETGKRQAWNGARSQIFHDNKLCDGRAAKMKALMEAENKKGI